MGRPAGSGARRRAAPVSRNPTAHSGARTARGRRYTTRRMRSVLVTGGAGFIGCNFVRLLLAESDWHVVVLDKLTYAGHRESLAAVESNPRYRFVHGDIADRELLRRLFAEEAFDAVVNFAAESHVDRSIESPGDF